VLKIEIVYKDSQGNILKKEDIQKQKISKIRTINPNLVDSSGFYYKTKKSKNSAVKVYTRQPEVTPSFCFKEDSASIKIENQKFFLSYDKNKNQGELYQKIDPTLVKNFLKDQKRIIKQIRLEIEKIEEAKIDEESFLKLIETI
jgi:hypothetical protein